MAEPLPHGESDTVAAGAAPAPAPPPSLESLSAESPSAPPKRLAGRYELLSLLGVGGMGAVYRAKDLELDEVVALKMLRRELVSDAGLLARFRQEVKLARRVTHKNVARTFDIGEDEGQKFLTMELVEGESLAALLGRVGRMPLAKVVPLTEEICAGLSAAHAAGIVHRDLKPENVLIGLDGRVVLTDFGIARATRELDASLVKTMGVPIGTPAYMAPEQALGSKDIDARADLYALGAMLYELLTGERPWDGDSAYAVAAKRLLLPPPDPRAKVPDLPDAAARLTMRCMAKSPDDRFATASEVAGALAGLTLPAPTGLTAPPPVARLASPTQTPAGAKTVAVLPFRNGGPPEDEYLADGLTDDLIDNLSMTEGLKVRSRGVVMALKGIDKDPRELGATLDVQVVVEGSVRRAAAGAERLRVNARVVSVSDGFQLWAKRFDCAAGDVLAVGDELVRAVALALTVEQGSPPRDASADPVALDLYMRARHRYFQGPRGLRGAVELFEQALERAPDHPTILAGYAMAQIKRFAFEETKEAEGEKGRQAAEQALARTPRLGEARVALANYKLTIAAHAAAARELNQALKDAPGLADAHELAARMLLEAGAFEEGLVRARSALALEPRLAGADWMIPRAYLLRGDVERALLAMPPVPEEPGAYWLNRGRMAFWMRDVPFAREWFPKLRARDNAPRGAVAMLGLLVDDPAMLMGMPAVELSSSAPGKAVRRRQFFSQIRAEVFGYLGDVERSMAGLVDANKCELFDLEWLRGCPLLEPLRRDPAYPAILEAVEARAKIVRLELGAKG